MLPKLALAPLIVLVFGIGIASKIAIATALTVVVSNYSPPLAGVKAVDPTGEKLFYSLGATRLQAFASPPIPCAAADDFGAAGGHRARVDRCIVGEFFIGIRTRPRPRDPGNAGETGDPGHRVVGCWAPVLSTLAVIMYVTVLDLARARPAQGAARVRRSPAPTSVFEGRDWIRWAQPSPAASCLACAARVSFWLPEPVHGDRKDFPLDPGKPKGYFLMPTSIRSRSSPSNPAPATLMRC